MVSYKDEHQRFMSGHTGTSLGELILILSAVCMATPVRDVLLLWTCPYHRGLHPLFRFVLDFGIIVVPSLLIVTLFSDSVILTFSCLTFFTFVLFLAFILKHRTISVAISLQYVNIEQRKTFVTNFRSILNLITALSILAVDFQVFPRKLAKTEEFGYGMMDFGVSFFVLSNAIVSPEARGKENNMPKLIQIKKAVISSLPLLVIGFLRLISVKGTDYQEHVTEYGAHWNFFFTLAALKVSSTLLFCMIPHIKPGITGVLLLCGHQYCMSNGLSEYIIQGLDGKGGRTTLVDANREGIFSLAGYVSLYMMGVQLGRFLFIHRSNLWEWLRAVVYLLVVATIMVFFNTVLHVKIQMVSRRFANASYVLSSMILSYIALIICLMGDIAKAYCTSINKTSASQGSKAKITFSQASKGGDDLHAENPSTSNECGKLKKEKGKDLCLLQAISFNSLLFFLVANLMTGFVNMSMSTIHTTATKSMAVLGIYSFVLSLLFVVLYSKNVKTKFW